MISIVDNDITYGTKTLNMQIKKYKKTAIDQCQNWMP